MNYWRYSHSRFITVPMLMGGLCIVPPGGFAQVEIEEITVTATRRLESIQDVPVSVSVIDEDRMAAMGIDNMQNLSSYVPNFQMAEATMITNLYMRGLGSGLAHSTEQSVGLFVDGVYIGRSTANNMGFLDVGTVEVLRGPQGTLFGKNTVAGALIVRTNDPTDELAAGISLSAGAYSTVGNRSGIEGFVSGPVGESFSYRVAGKLSQSDGYVENLANGPDGAERNDGAIRAKLRWTASDITTVDFRIDHFEYQTTGQVASETFNAPPPILGPFRRVDPSFSNTLDWKANYNCGLPSNGNFCPDRDQELQAYAMTVNHDIGPGTLTSISALQEYEYTDNFYASENGLLGIFTALRIEDFDSFSQELRFASDVGGTTDYILGLYYDSNSIDRDQATSIDFPTLMGVLGPAVPPLPPLARGEDWDQDTQTIAAFGQVRWHLNDQFTLNLGGRFSSEDKDFEFDRYYTHYLSSTRFNTSILPPPAQAGLFGNLGPIITREQSRSSRSEDSATGSLTLQYEPEDNMMLYFSLAQGHKTGGFDDRVIALDDIGFDEETSLMNELGLKGGFFDGRLQFNMALFDIGFEDLQVSSFQPESLAFLTSNAGEATSRGIEIDWQFRPSANWYLGGSFANLDAHYDTFLTAPCTTSQRMGFVPGCQGGQQDLSGQTLQFAPESQVNLFGEYLASLNSGWNVIARVEANFSSEYYLDLDLDPNFLQDDYTKIDIVLRVVSPGGTSEIALVGRNITEEAIMTFGSDTPILPTYFGGLEPPREISLRYSHAF